MFPGLSEDVDAVDLVEFLKVCLGRLLYLFNRRRCRHFEIFVFELEPIEIRFSRFQFVR
jgi:hypothetical protein